MGMHNHKLSHTSAQHCPLRRRPPRRTLRCWAGWCWTNFAQTFTSSPKCSCLPQTTKAHITVLGGVVEELVTDAGLVVTSDNPFKGDMDCQKLTECIEKYTPERIAFVRVEAGGSPVEVVVCVCMRGVGGLCCTGGSACVRVCTRACGGRGGLALCWGVVPAPGCWPHRSTLRALCQGPVNTKWSSEGRLRAACRHQPDWRAALLAAEPEGRAPGGEGRGGVCMCMRVWWGGFRGGRMANAPRVRVQASACPFHSMVLHWVPLTKGGLIEGWSQPVFVLGRAACLAAQCSRHAHTHGGAPHLVSQCPHVRVGETGREGKPSPLLPLLQVCDKYGVLLIMDASLLSDNLHVSAGQCGQCSMRMVHILFVCQGTPRRCRTCCRAAPEMQPGRRVRAHTPCWPSPTHP